MSLPHPEKALTVGQLIERLEALRLEAGEGALVLMADTCPVTDVSVGLGPFTDNWPVVYVCDVVEDDDDDEPDEGPDDAAGLSPLLGYGHEGPHIHKPDGAPVLSPGPLNN
jgi:hypothetical protein